MYEGYEQFMNYANLFLNNQESHSESFQINLLSMLLQKAAQGVPALYLLSPPLVRTFANLY